MYRMQPLANQKVHFFSRQSRKNVNVIAKRSVITAADWPSNGISFEIDPTISSRFFFLTALLPLVDLNQSKWN